MTWVRNLLTLSLCGGCRRHPSDFVVLHRNLLHRGASASRELSHRSASRIYSPSPSLRTGTNTFTLQNLACHPRFRRESDAIHRAAVSDGSISAHPATADEVEHGVPDVENGHELLPGGFDVTGNGSDRVENCAARNREDDSVVGPGILLPYGLSGGGVREGHL